MTAYIKFQSVLKKLEDKGYVKVKLVDNYWHYTKIICEQNSVTNKLKEYLNQIDKEDYFYGTTKLGGNSIYLFNTRVFVDDFDRICMEQREQNYFDWDRLSNTSTFSFALGSMKKTFINILKPKGYRFEHPHNSSYCRCWNTKMIEERKKRQAQRSKEIDDFLETL